jgi:hypothetical protein
MSDWPNWAQFSFNALSFAVFGAILGLFCGIRTLLALLLSVPVSIGCLMLGAWYAGTFSDQFAFHDPMGTLEGMGPFYLFFCLIPTSAAALFVTILWRWRSKKTS